MVNYYRYKVKSRFSCVYASVSVLHVKAFH